MPGKAGPFRLGLTGGIGSGKSTVAALMGERGAAVIDADAISRSLTAPHGRALPEIAAIFGVRLIGVDGALDREAMRDLVFRDPRARERLQAILHPLVAAEVEHQSRQAADAAQRLLVLDIPLLVEAGDRWRPRLDRVLVVDCPPEIQVQRVMARNQLTRAQVLQIQGAQADRATRLSAADWVIFNGQDVTVSELGVLAARLAARFGL